MDSLDLAKRAMSEKTSEHYERVLAAHDARFPRSERTLKHASKRGGRPLSNRIGPSGHTISSLYAGKSCPDQV